MISAIFNNDVIIFKMVVDQQVDSDFSRHNCCFNFHFLSITTYFYLSLKRLPSVRFIIKFAAMTKENDDAEYQVYLNNTHTH